MMHKRYNYSLWIISILISSFFLCSCTDVKEKGLYDQIKPHTAIFLTYSNFELSREDIPSMEKIIDNLSFEKFNDQQYPGLASIWLTLKCEDREICIRLSAKAWSFWEKEKPVIGQYNGKLPVWRKYKSPDETQKVFEKVFYKNESEILKAPRRKTN